MIGCICYSTQSDIIETIEQTLQIQQNGRQKRKEAEKELVGLDVAVSIAFCFNIAAF
jgi:uncharacterized protein YaaN involved in tellurite resistance